MESNQSYRPFLTSAGDPPRLQITINMQWKITYDLLYTAEVFISLVLLHSVILQPKKVQCVYLTFMWFKKYKPTPVKMKEIIQGFHFFLCPVTLRSHSYYYLFSGYIHLPYKSSRSWQRNVADRLGIHL